jgi:murein DD-endopeptidase MepM/ murein hydrolase activator NlpD
LSIRRHARVVPWLILSLAIGLATAADAPNAHGQSAARLRDRLEGARSRAADAKSDLAAKKVAAGRARNRLVDAQEQLAAATSRLRRAQARLAQTREDLERVRAQLDKTRKQLAAHQGAMQGRLLALFRSQEPSYAEVVLRSTSFEDFANRSEFTRRIAQRDESVLISIVQDKQKVEAQQALLVTKEAEQEQLKAKVSREKREVAAKTAEARQLAAAAQHDVAEATRQLDEMEAEVSAVGSMLRRLAAQRRSGSSGGGYSHATPWSGDGRWPVNGPITSPYGWRMHPITHTRRFHDGVDIGASGGTPIHCAAAGTVVSTGWRGAYGLVVLVDHGSGLATMYCHCETGSVQVGPGQEVGKGQVLARVDSTGWSTGNHLHFSVFRDGEHVDPTSVF